MNEPDPASKPIPYEPIKHPDQTNHVHVWTILDVWRPATEAYHPRLIQSNITVVLVKCKTCELPQTIELQGVWTLEQILKNHARIEHRGK
jgi:hypothetical protein